MMIWTSGKDVDEYLHPDTTARLLSDREELGRGPLSINIPEL